jgi:tetratricopeptide (TPR) repeat protein
MVDGHTPRDVAEAIWLSSFLEQDDLERKDPAAGRTPAAGTGPSTPPDRRPAAAQDVSAGGGAGGGEEGGPPGGDAQERRFTHHPTTEPASGRPRPTGPVTERFLPGQVADVGRGIPAAPALDDPLGIHRALRPLAQSVPSGSEQALDEVKTAEHLADDPPGVPVYRPARERRWEIVLVVEDSPSMCVWLDTVPDLVATIERLGVFRNVHLRFARADADRPGVVRLRASRSAVITHTPSEVVEPTGRRILWLLTDGLGPAWRFGAMEPLLWSWGRRMPVAVVSPLPQHLWQSAGFRTHRLSMSMPRSSGPSSAARWRFRDLWDELSTDRAAPSAGLSVPVPLLELNPRWLAPWAGFLSGDHGSWTDLTALVLTPDAGEARAEDPLFPDGPAPSARERVRRFRATASPAAFALATHLAAAPLTWAVLRLVQDMVPGARRAHVAELFVTRLIRAIRPDYDDPEQITLDFEAGVREELLACGRRSDTKRVLRAVGELLGPRVSALREVGRILDEPDVATVPSVTDDNRPFLAIVGTALSALSGRYLSRARRLCEIVDADPAGLVDVPPSDHPQRRATDSVGVMTASDDRGIPTTPPPRSATPDSSLAPGHQAAVMTDGGDTVSSITAATAVGPRHGSRAPAVWGHVPPKNPNFTGRQELLRELHVRLHEGTTAVLPEALHGMGGVGKSQLAVEYVYLHQADYDVVWWIPAERPAQIGSALVELAKRLGVGGGAEANTAVPAVIDALRTGVPHDNWLLVFDNAEDPRTVREYFPQGGRGRVLVTSRNAQWANVARSLEVDVFTREESKELLRRRGPELSDDDADGLAEALGDLPLAIEQAATWLAETGMSAAEYLRLFNEKRSELLGTDPPVDYQLPVTAAWNVSLDRLTRNSPAALRLLQVCAFFAPEPISRQLFVRGRTAVIAPDLDAALRDPIKLNQAIREINKYALARIDHRTNSIQMHRLVQAVLVERMKPDERETMRHGAHELLAASDPNEPDNAENWGRYAELYPHVLASGAVHGQDPWIRALLVNEVQYLFRWGEHEESRRLAQQTYDTWRKSLGDDDPNTLKIASWLGWVLLAVGRYQEAAEVNARLLELCKRVHGEDHEETLEALANVAADKRVAGEFAEAFAVSEEAYRRASRALGPDEPAALVAAHNVGVDLRLLGRFVEAQQRDEDTWQRKVRLFGEDDQRTLLTLDSLLIDRRELGDYLGARMRQEELVEQYERVLNSEFHPSLLAARRDLSVMRRKAGDHEGALVASRDVHRRLVSRYGEDHPQSMAASLCLSMDLRHAGDLAAARELCEQTRDRYRRAFGEDHPHTVTAAVNLAIIHRLSGDIEAAYALDNASLQLFERRLGRDHPSSLVCATNLANDLYDLGEFQTARDIDTDVVDRSPRLLGEDHPAVLAGAANLAMDIRALGRPDEAERMHVDMIQRMDRILGTEHRATRNAAAWVRSDCDIDPMPL